MRILFAGSPDVAVPTLEALVKNGHEVCVVLSQPPKPVGRSKVLTPTPVHRYATESGLEVRTPTSSAELMQVVTEMNPDVAIVVAYGRILTKQTLDLVPRGWWNVHFSLLPQWRGAAPVQHSLLQGDSSTGISVFKIVEELDAGPLAVTKELPINPMDTTGTLLNRLGLEAPALVLELLRALETGTVSLVEQVGDVSVAPKLEKGAGVLRLSEPGELVAQRFRAVTPEPGAKIFRTDTGSAITVIGAHLADERVHLEPGHLSFVGGEVLLGTGTMPLMLDEVQPQGKRPMPAVDWYRGLPTGVAFDVKA